MVPKTKTSKKELLLKGEMLNFFLAKRYFFKGLNSQLKPTRSQK